MPRQSIVMHIVMLIYDGSKWRLMILPDCAAWNLQTRDPSERMLQDQRRRGAP